MKISIFAAMLAATASATPAFAQDNELNFSGLRFEARAGLDKVRGRVTIPDPDDADETVTARVTDSAPGMTIYILIAIGHEERDLVGLFGEKYDAYRGRAGKLIPKL